MSEEKKPSLLDKTTAALGSAHSYTSDKLLQLFGGLFMEQKDEDGDGVSVWVASLGRYAFWIVFGHMMWVWAGYAGELKAPDTTELNAFYALLGYQGAKVGKDMVVEGATAWKGNGQQGDGA